MVGEKKKNCYRKTKRRKPFTGVQRYSQACSQAIEKASETVGNESNEKVNKPTCVGSSRKKMKLQHDAEHEPTVTAEDSSDFKDDEYRLIKGKCLLSVLCEIHGCKNGIYS